MVQSLKLARQASMQRLSEIEDHDGFISQEGQSGQLLSPDSLATESNFASLESPQLSGNLPSHQRASLWLKNLENDYDHNAVRCDHRASLWLESLENDHDHDLIDLRLLLAHAESTPVWEFLQKKEDPENNLEKSHLASLGYLFRQFHNQSSRGQAQSLALNKLSRELYGQLESPMLFTISLETITSPGSRPYKTSTNPKSKVAAVLGHEKSSSQLSNQLILPRAQSAYSESAFKPPSLGHHKAGSDTTLRSLSRAIGTPPSTLEAPSSNSTDHKTEEVQRKPTSPSQPPKGSIPCWKFRKEDKCFQIIIMVLRKNGREAEDWPLYELFLVYDGGKQWLGHCDKPLAMWKELEKNGKNPRFSLHRWTEFVNNSASLLGDDLGFKASDSSEARQKTKMLELDRVRDFTS